MVVTAGSVMNMRMVTDIIKRVKVYVFGLK